MTASATTNLAHHYADLSEVRMHYVTAGEGFPVVLLHGWPQTWYAWRGIIDRLAPHYRVIAPDLRGLGDTSRPASGYDKKTIAADVWELVHDELKLDNFYLVGHDWGGPTAYALAAHHPDAVRKLAVIDVTIPGDGGPDISQGGKRWHHAFNRTPELPEALVSGREAVYLGWFYRTFAHRTEAMTSLLALAAAQERHFLTYRVYATTLEGTGAALAIAPLTRSGRYRLSVSGDATGGYLAKATARPDGPQAADRECITLTLDANGTRRAYSASGEDSTMACWGR